MLDKCNRLPDASADLLPIGKLRLNEEVVGGTCKCGCGGLCASSPGSPSHGICMAGV